MNRIGIGAAAIALAVGTAGTAGWSAPPAAKQVVRTQDDLPRHSYPVKGTAAALLAADDATFNAWARQVDADAAATLAGYDIQDRATLRKLLGTRLSYQQLIGQDRAALATVRQIRALEDKPDARLTSGVRTEAMLKARIATGARTGAAYERAYAADYAAALKAMPWAVVGNALKEARGNAQLLSRSLVEGYILQQVEPIVARDHRVSDQPAADLLWARVAIRNKIPVQALTVAALNRTVAANAVAKPDIWAAREVTLTAADQTTPVVAAVWDSGTDLALFPEQTYTDPHPEAGGPYHPHGLGFDVESRPDPVWLYPLTPVQQAGYQPVVADFQGFADLQQAIDSPAADAFKAKLAAMPAAAQPDYFETLSLYGNYLHGTHVAGIMARGNPAIRLASARITYDHRNVPAPPTEAGVKRTAAAYRTTVWRGAISRSRATGCSPR